MKREPLSLSLSLTPSLFHYQLFTLSFNVTSTPGFPPHLSMPSLFHILLYLSCFRHRFPLSLHGSSARLDQFLRCACVIVCVKHTWYLVNPPGACCIFLWWRALWKQSLLSDCFTVSHRGQPTHPQICREHGRVDRYKNEGCHGGWVWVFLKKSTVCCFSDHHEIFSITSSVWLWAAGQQISMKLI